MSHSGIFCGRSSVRSGRSVGARGSGSRRIPFEPKGRLAQLLKRRRFLGPKDSCSAPSTGEYQGTIRTAWDSLVLPANGIEPTRTRARRGRHADRGALRQRRERAHVSLRPVFDPQAFEANEIVIVLGGELEQQRPTASTRRRSLRCSTATRKNDRPNALSPNQGRGSKTGSSIRSQAVT